MSVTPASVRRASPLPPSERRASIVAAVLPLLIDRGVTVTTRQLAEAAEVSEGTLFNVFADKDELIAAAVETAVAVEPFERAVAEIDLSAPLDARLVAATRIIQRRIVDIWRLVSRLDHHPDHGPLPDSPALAALFEPERAQLRQTPVEAARLLRAMTLSLTHPALTARRRSADEIVDLFLNGVRRGASGVDGGDR